MDPSLLTFARLARRLELDSDAVGEADADRLREFCAEVLDELTALGLLPDTAIGCHARRRPKGN